MASEVDKTAQGGTPAEPDQNDVKPDNAADAKENAATAQSADVAKKPRRAPKRTAVSKSDDAAAVTPDTPADSGTKSAPRRRAATGAKAAATAKSDAVQPAKPAETGAKRVSDSTKGKDAAGAGRTAARGAKRTAAPADRRTPPRRKPAARKPAQIAATEEISVETPIVETPIIDTPVIETPVIETPVVKNPPIEANPVADSTDGLENASFVVSTRMTTRLAENIERIESLTQRLFTALSQRRMHSPAVEAPGPELFLSAGAAWARMLAEQPSRILQQQVQFWGETLKHYTDTQAALVKGGFRVPDDGGPLDSRFKNPLWRDHPFFSFIRTQYEINARALENAAAELDMPDEVGKRRIAWLTRQLVDMMAPTNFLATNPDALEKAIETEGESLVRGLENLVRDVERRGGEMIVSLVDTDAFHVGDNIGTTPGKVVLRTPLFELIQFTPTTEKVHETPLVIFPPWINKYYILDLKPQNSLIKWIVDQGYTLFVMSWKNPDASYAETGIEDYIASYLTAMDTVLSQTGQKKLNVVGYCIAGTALALTLSLLKHRGDDRVNSATFFTTLTDFSDQGEFTPFLQDDFVEGIAAEIEETGYLSSSLMTRTFSFLRANDLVWGPAIRSYMLGEAPPAFDLLFWNDDGTNLPGKMAMEYLRKLCQQNQFARDGIEVMGQVLSISDVTLPLCAVACETDHIAPWRDCWRGISEMASADRTFIMSQSGHIAGIINPPSKKKYGHYTSDGGFAGGVQGWKDAAQFHQGSWWPRWGDWLAARSGAMIDARAPAADLGDAPGIYVHEKPL